MHEVHAESEDKSVGHIELADPLRQRTIEEADKLHIGSHHVQEESGSAQKLQLPVKQGGKLEFKSR